MCAKACNDDDDVVELERGFCLLLEVSFYMHKVNVLWIHFGITFFNNCYIGANLCQSRELEGVVSPHVILHVQDYILVL